MTGYIGFGNDTLNKLQEVKEESLILCPNCNSPHELKCGISNGIKSNTIMFFNCGDKVYIGAINGKLITGIKPDCTDEI